MLDAAYDAEKATVGEPYVLCIEVQDVPGVLNQVGSGGAFSGWAAVVLHVEFRVFGLGKQPARWWAC